jgi:hypothetical protein
MVFTSFGPITAGLTVLRRPGLSAATSIASTSAADTLAPCPCCGGRMIIIEIFERGCAQQYSPDPKFQIWAEICSVGWQ